MMRAMMLAALLFAGGPANAYQVAAFPHLMEFDEALAAYRRGDHEVARVAFHHLAELGDSEARFNLGVMLLRGEGGDRDEAGGFAWVRSAAAAGVTNAIAAVPAIEPELDAETIGLAEAQLDSLQARLDADRFGSAGPDAARIHHGCLARHMKRREPRYPQEAARRQQFGYATLHFLVAPDGNVDAVHAMPSLIRDDPFAKPAVQALRGWRAPDCPSTRYRTARQVVIFELPGGGHPGELSPATRRWADMTLAAARDGSPAHAFQVAEIDRYVPHVFSLEPGERASLMLHAALAGIPEARYRLGVWLYRDAPYLAWRWFVLAARQGFAPAQVMLSGRDDLADGEAHRALIEAAEAGYLPAVLLAVRRLAMHPNPQLRDGERALSLTAALDERLLRTDPSMAEAHAAALAESGRFEEAVRWQERALREGRRLKRDLGQSESRLVAYREARAWRDQALIEHAAVEAEFVETP